MELAPSENPESMLMISGSPRVVNVFRVKKRSESPIRPRPTTVSPMTVPLAYDTRKAFAIPSRAALVVRTLAIVAAVMPTNPAVAESTAPMMNATEVRG
ncbi:MAG: hypothetical protein A4E37_01817 [Methanoregulaceae archaeon PtaB.Bin056]|nr:MAG: hypothetical protein A4E37_01817 [Methanoregulaceae archaeon PtaB.Bin056]